MPTKINAFSAATGEPIHLSESWFSSQLAPSHILTPCSADGNGHEIHHHVGISTRSYHNPVVSASHSDPSPHSHSMHNAVINQSQRLSHLASSCVMSASANSLSNLSDPCGSATSSVCRRMSLRHQPPAIIDGLTFEHSDEALAWTLTKRKLLAIVAKADCFVNARTCPYDVLVGVSVAENPANGKAAGSGDRIAASQDTSSILAATSPPATNTHLAAGANAQTPISESAAQADGTHTSSLSVSPTPSCTAASAAVPVANGGTAGSIFGMSQSPTASSASPMHFGSAVAFDPLAPSAPRSVYSANTASITNNASCKVVDPAIEPEYCPWPITKSTLGEVLGACAEEMNINLNITDDAPKASDAVGFAAAMVAKLCGKNVLHNPNKSEAHFVVNLLVLSRPIGNEYAPSHGLYRVPHAPSAVAKERCSSAVVLSVIGKVMEETRALALQAGVGQNLQKTDSGAGGKIVDCPPLPRAAIGVAEKVKQHGSQLLQELQILELNMAAEAQRREAIERGGAALAAQLASQREADEAAVLEKLLLDHFANSITVVVQFTGSDERDALFALLDSRGDLEAAAGRLMEDFTAEVAPTGSLAPTHVTRLRQFASDFLDSTLVHNSLEAKLGNGLGALNPAGCGASGAPLTAANLPLVNCAARLVSLGYAPDEANRASRGAGGKFELAAQYLAGDHSVQRVVRQHYEEVLWFTTVVEMLHKGHSKASLQSVKEVVAMIAEDPQSVLIAWHTPSQQQAVRTLSDAFVQAIMQYKQTAMFRLQQQQQQARTGTSHAGSAGHSATASAGIATTAPKTAVATAPAPTVAPADRQSTAHQPQPQHLHQSAGSAPAGIAGHSSSNGGGSGVSLQNGESGKGAFAGGENGPRSNKPRNNNDSNSNINPWGPNTQGHTGHAPNQGPHHRPNTGRYQQPNGGQYHQQQPSTASGALPYFLPPTQQQQMPQHQQYPHPYGGHPNYHQQQHHQNGGVMSGYPYAGPHTAATGYPPPAPYAAGGGYYPVQQPMPHQVYQQPHHYASGTATDAAAYSQQPSAVAPSATVPPPTGYGSGYSQPRQQPPMYNSGGYGGRQ